MRKFLSKIFWSHGTPLGSLGPLSQQDTILGAGQHHILVIWGPYRPPIVVALETQAENPKTAGQQCGGYINRVPICDTLRYFLIEPMCNLFSP